MTLKHAYAAHDGTERRPAVGHAPVFIVKILRTVYRHPHQPVVALQKQTPLVGEQRGVGLKAVGDIASGSILLLQLQNLAIEVELPHRSLPSMPCENDIRSGLRGDILLDKLLERSLRHHLTARVGIISFLLKVVAVGARHVAGRAYRLWHDIDRSGERVDHRCDGVRS